MKNTLSLLLLLLPVSLLAQPGASPAALAFTHVTVIDVNRGLRQPDTTVIIERDRITVIGRTSGVRVPQSARVIDASGRFMIPGLWDMHVHLAVPAADKDANRRYYLPLLIANGVTGVRDMYSEMQTINAWRREIATGMLLGPRIVATGHILDGPGTRSYTVVRNADEARAAVTAVKQEASDFVKVYSVLTRDGYFAIAHEAKRQRINFAGHVPLTVTVAEASNAGQQSIEHLTGMLLAASAREHALRRELEATANADILVARRAFDHAELRGLDSYSDEKAAHLFAQLARNGTWQCPTLVVLRAGAFRDNPEFVQDPRLDYMTAATRRRWGPSGDPEFERSAEDGAIDKALYRKQLEIVGAMQRAGVGLLAGTDMTNPYVFPGFSLHDELELMVQAGLTPLQALQTATLNPARYLGREHDLGTINVGKLADLVLLNADPLLHIGNTRRIDGVVVAGRFIDASQRQTLLAAVAAGVAEK